MSTAKSRFTSVLLATAIAATGFTCGVRADDAAAATAGRSNIVLLTGGQALPTALARHLAKRSDELVRVLGPLLLGTNAGEVSLLEIESSEVPQRIAKAGGVAPGPAPPGKVWSVEHGHWHDLKPPPQVAPGPAPPGKVWSAEHGHWHDLRSPPQSERMPTTVKNDRITFELPDLEGNLVSSSDERFGGKVLLLDIWGTWCPPCRVEIPHLVRIYKKYQEQGLEIVGLAFEQGDNKERNLETLTKFSEDNGIKYTVLYGGSTAEVGKQLPSIENFSGFPTTIYINRVGEVVKVDVGFGDAKAPEMERTIRDLLNVSKPLKAVPSE